MSDPIYKTIPALAAYIDRVGAEQLNFRRFMIKEESSGGYYTERALIKINNNNEISCSAKEYAPTKEEIQVIKAALGELLEWPRCIPAPPTKLSMLESLINGSSRLFEFWNLAREGILMCQERMNFSDGRKAYVPWSYWSDDEWRRMEPDGALPFWKPRERRHKVSIMVHEGAKAAAFIDDLVNNPERADELAAHPWGEELRECEHWGMIGGALAPHRAMYAELQNEKPQEVIYVCDNDWAGNRALQDVSRAYAGNALKGIRFGNYFPQSWDMADPLPKALFGANGHWNGPKLREELMVPATWATEQVESQGKGRPGHSLKRTFCEEWYHCIAPEVFVHRDWPNRIWGTKEFNNKIAPFSDVDDTARLLKKDATSKVATLKYRPDQVAGIYASEETERYINTFCQASIVARPGDVGPWLSFMNHLVPDAGDRTELMRWCATLIARPDIKMFYGVLLISESQGIGKSTLGEKILTPLVGVANVSSPSEREIVESNFNGWCAHKRLAVIHEIYAGNSSKAYDNLKSIASEKTITVNQKYQATYPIDNWLHLFACSNSIRALKLSDDDRRWFVPKLTERLKANDYWFKFNSWLSEEGGLSVIKWWAEEWLKEHQPVMPGQHAPMSAMKKEMIIESRSPGMTGVANLLNYINEKRAADNFDGLIDVGGVSFGCRPEGLNGAFEEWSKKYMGALIILDTQLVGVIRQFYYEGRHSDRLEKPVTIRKLAKSMGWYIHPDRAQISKWGSRHGHARLICSTPDLLGVPVSELAESLSPLDVVGMAARLDLFGSSGLM